MDCLKKVKFQKDQKWRQSHKAEIFKKKKEYRETHKEQIRQHKREEYQKNKYRILERVKKYNLLNKVKKSKYLKNYYKKNKEQLLKNSLIYNNNRRKTDVGFKILCNLRHRVYMVLKNNFKSKHTLKLLSCSLESLKKHLESQFKPGMSWSNYGKWHVDHIIPCASFDLSKSEEQRKCFHYTNLQPLWAEDNWQKSRKEKQE